METYHLKMEKILIKIIFKKYMLFKKMIIDFFIKYIDTKNTIILN